MERKPLLALLGLTAAGLAAGCVLQHRSEQQSASCARELFAMDTIMRFTAYGANCERAVDAAIEEVQRLDELLSTGSPSSEIFRINVKGSSTASEDTLEILEAAQEIYESTEGLFDFTVYPLMELWGFPSKEYHVPAEEELEAVLPLVNAARVSMNGNTITLGENQKIDFGGIAKGYTSARVMEVFKEQGACAGIVTLGGNVQALNVKPDGSKWRVGIQNPDTSKGGNLGILSVDNKAVITSGGYERYFEQDGNTYIHILNPKTGYPADEDLISVTIVSEDGMLADALSTSLYIMGLDKAIEYWRSRTEDFDMILVTDEQKIYVTEGINEDFQCEERVFVIE